MSDCSGCGGIGFGPGGGGFAVAGTPAIGKVIGWDGTQPIWENVPTNFAVNSFGITTALVLVGATVNNPPFTASYNILVKITIYVVSLIKVF